MFFRDPPLQNNWRGILLLRHLALLSCSTSFFPLLKFETRALLINSTSHPLSLIFARCSCSARPHRLARWWRCHWKSACGNATLWRRCSLSPPQLSMMPAGSSERGSQRLKLDRVRITPTWLQKQTMIGGFLCKDKERSINFTGRGEDFCSKKQYVGNVA